jgi:hypothetical protein
MNPMQGAESQIRSGHVIRLALLLVVGWLPVIFGRDAVAAVSSLNALARGPGPYFNLAHAGLLYGWSPLVCLSAMVALLSPGFLLAIVFDGASSVAAWILNSVAISLVLVSAAALFATDGGQFLIVLLICHAAATGFLLLRLRSGALIVWPSSVATLLMVGAASWLMIAALTPKIFWEDFNGDGVHAFESARRLLNSPVPFWPAEAGDMSSFPGTTTMLASYPISWFLRLFGEPEASSRLPFVLYIASLFAAIVALVESGRARLSVVSRLLIWAGLAVYVVAIGYSDAYSPYSSDLALPAAQHTFHVVLFLGVLLAYFEERFLWMFFYLALSYLSLPTAALLTGFWLLSMALVWKPVPFKKLALVVVGLLACMGFGALFPHILKMTHLPLPGSEHGLFGLAKHFAYLNLTDWHRFLFVVVPTGGLPFLSLLWWRRQDRISKSITLVTLAYFFFFYFQARTALHYYIPAMLLPLIVFWRTVPDATWLRRATAGAAALCLFLSLPEHWIPYTTSRQLSSYFECKYDAYGKGVADLRWIPLIGKVFPSDWEPEVPFSSFGGSPLVFHHYAHRAKLETVEPNYIIQLADRLPPEGSKLFAVFDEAALFLRNDTLWEQQLSIRPNTPAGSMLYRLPREELFLTLGDNQEIPGVINLKAELSKRGFNMDAIRRMLGEKQK